MTVALSPILQYFDNDGRPLSGGKLFTYQAGTIVPLPTFTNRGGGTPNSNPVVLDSSGRAQIWLIENTPYKLVLQSADGVTIDTTDNFYAGTDPSALIGVQVLTGVGTFTPVPGTRRIRGRMVGGGGAGGGAPATSAGQCGAGAGGGSGAYLEFEAVTGFLGAAYSVGSPGVPVLGLAGGDGGETYFGGYVASGGRGGASFGPTAPPILAGYTNPVIAQGGYLNVPGRSSGPILIISNVLGYSGTGADGQWGAGGTIASGSSDGAPGRGFGAGGSGGITNASSVARYGGTGTPGFMQIEQYT